MNGRVRPPTTVIMTVAIPIDSEVEEWGRFGICALKEDGQWFEASGSEFTCVSLYLLFWILCMLYVC